MICTVYDNFNNEYFRNFSWILSTPLLSTPLLSACSTNKLELGHLLFFEGINSSGFKVLWVWQVLTFAVYMDT